DGIRDKLVTGVQTCALPICAAAGARWFVAHAADLELPDLDTVWRTLTPIWPELVLDLGQGGTRLVAAPDLADGLVLKMEGQTPRSEERRVGKEGRWRGGGGG